MSTSEKGSYGKWIPVSERLPEKNNRPFYPMCLVTTKEGHICLCVYRKDNKEWWTRFSEGETCYSTQHDVTAWMSLPEPYQESEVQE